MIQLHPTPRQISKVFTKADYENEYKVLEQMLGTHFVTHPPKSIIEAYVVNITKDYVIVDINTKSLGYIHRSEFEVTGFGELPKVDSKIMAYFHNFTEKNGILMGSYKKAAQKIALEELTQAHQNGSLVDGIIGSKTRGGYYVTLVPSRAEAFLPVSQLDIVPSKEKEQLVSMQKQTFPYYVLSISNTSIVVSRKMPAKQAEKKEQEAQSTDNNKKT